MGEADRDLESSELVLEALRPAPLIAAIADVDILGMDKTSFASEPFGNISLSTLCLDIFSTVWLVSLELGVESL